MKNSTTNNTSTVQVTLFDVAEPHSAVLPYGGTSGWSGSDTSKQRATSNDASGLTSTNQRATLIQLKLTAHKGLTWNELANALGWHHGTASGALSVLHKAGLIARLTEKRNKCAVYVSLDYINGRETQAHRPNVSARLLMEILEELETDLEQGHISTALARVKATKQALS